MKIEESIIRQILIEIQDYLVPNLDSYEQMIYHYLFRNTYLEGKSTTLIGIRTVREKVGFGVGKSKSFPSQNVIKKKLRSLENKGCIKLISRSVRGSEIQVLLPKEILGIIPEASSVTSKQLKELDFFNTPELRLVLLKRESHKCFYCLKSLSEENYTVDHIFAQVAGGTHSYTNVVACCFDCNSRKQDKTAKSFFLKNYRDGLLTSDEHQERLQALEAVASGKVKPDLERIV